MDKAKRDVMVPLWMGILDTSEELAANDSRHLAHLRYARHLLETATEAWWDQVDGDVNGLTLALDQTAKTAQCDHGPTIEAARVMGWGGF